GGRRTIHRQGIGHQLERTGEPQRVYGDVQLRVAGRERQPTLHDANAVSTWSGRLFDARKSGRPHSPLPRGSESAYLSAFSLASVFALASEGFSAASGGLSALGFFSSDFSVPRGFFFASP